MAATPSGNSTPPQKCCACRSEEHTSELQSHSDLVCRLLLVQHPPISPLFPYTTLFRSASPDPVFNVGGINVRGVEPRNTPTMINAVFNHRNFWDGRARFEFNGRNPIGKLDPTAKVLRVQIGRAHV